MRASLVACVTLCAAVARADPPPPRVLWAWERPEDLRFLPADVGVAFLHATVTLGPDGATVARRRQPLRVNPGAHLVAVVHVTVQSSRAPWSPTSRRAVIDAMAEAARARGVRGVQIDLDAPASRRAEYRALLGEVRAAVGGGTWLSMTALASWCEGDAWLDDAPLPVDEVVPMVFSMGRDGDAVLAGLRSSRRFRARACRSSVGWAVGEPVAPVDGVTRRYVYNPHPWTASAAAPWLR